MTSERIENLTPPPWIPFYIPSQGWAACWQGPKTSSGVGPDGNLYPICHMRWTDGMRPEIEERLENEVHRICEAVNSFADSQKKIEGLREALRSMLNVFDRNLAPITLGRRVCDKAITALAETERE
jgi:hypothetical protein